MSDQQSTSPVNIEQLIANAGERVAASLAEVTAKAVADQLGWSVRDAVAKVAQEHILERVLPDVKAQLEEQHDVMVKAILGAALTSCDELGKRLAEGMMAQVTKNLSQSWTIKKIAEEVFR